MKTNKIQNSFAKIMKVWCPGGFSFLADIFTVKRLSRLIWKGCALAALLLPLILLTHATLQAQAFLEWAKKAGGSSGGDYAQGFGIAVDAFGNSYVTGPFLGTATFRGITLTSPGSEDIFVAKYDSNGELVWVKQAGGSDDDTGRGIAVDGSGNSYLTGDYRGSATFGPIGNQTILESAGATRDIFVAKYDPDGNFLWAKQAGGSGDDRGFGIGVDVSGNSYVTGYFEVTSTFEPGTDLTSAGDHDIFVAKYNSSGVLVWAKQAGGLGDDRGRGIAVDGSGNSYLTSFFTGSATFGPGEVNETILESAGFLDIYVAKYNGSGDLMWAKRAGGSGGTSNDVGFGIAADVNGNSYVTGFFSGSATFGPGEANQTILTSTGSFDIFVAKYDINGNLVWAKKAGGSSGDEGAGAGIAVDANCNSYVTGFFGGSTTFGPGEANQTILVSDGASDIFVAKYNNSGVLEWAKQAGGLSDDGTGLGIVADASGNSYVTGFFFGSAAFGGTTLTSTGDRDIFVAKFGQCAYHTIAFAGREWIVRQAYNEGAGPNNWSACPESIWVDNDGSLHLKIRYDATDGRWYSAEVYSDGFTQYGIHRFNIVTPAGFPLDGLDRNLVLGLFLTRPYAVYSMEPTVPFEIDIEFAKWGTARTENIDYTVWHTFQPFFNPANRRTEPGTLLLTPESSTSHFIDWLPSRVHFSSFKGHDTVLSQDDLLSEWNTADSLLPADSIPKAEDNLRLHMNLWLFNSDGNDLTLGDPPFNNQEFEIIIQDYFLLDPDNDGILDEVDLEPNTNSMRFSDGITTGDITDPGDQILRVRDSSNPNEGVVITAESSGESNAANIEMYSSPCTITPSTFPSSSFSLTDGDRVVVTCSSVTIKVLSGPVEITFVAADGTPATTTLSTGNTLTFDPITFTFTTPATNAVPTVILVNETEFIMPPGETITIAEFETFDVSVKIKANKFKVEGSFAPGMESNGINPLTEDVTLSVGTFTTTIPSGSFEFKTSGPLGKFEFEGTIAGARLKLKLIPLGSGSFDFMAQGKDVDMTGTNNPAAVSLRVKDDLGNTEASSDDGCGDCPGGDDSVDNNDDWVADCSQLLGYNDYSSDWHCGNNKIIVCHSGNTLCISKNALPAHFNHGDQVGPCLSCSGQNLIVPGGGKTTTTLFEAAELEVFPNPAGNEVSIHLHGVETATELTIYDQLGKVVWTGIMEEGQISTSISLDDSRFGNGIYFVSAITKGEKISRRLVIVR